MTDDLVKKLEECFANGATDVEACFIAGISKQTLYNYQKEFPEFVDRKEGLKSLTTYQAKRIISQSITEGDKSDAKWHLERRDPEHNPKNTTTLKGPGADGKIIFEVLGIETANQVADVGEGKPVETKPL